jgi:DNA repair protein RecN (Recombination protein N)
MLEHLKVQNVALIEECRVEFGGGLNILSGETGAGKSILIDSLGFVLGARAGSEFVRKGAENAYVEAFFRVMRPEVIAQLRDMGLAVEEDGAVLIQRSQSGSQAVSGKTICKVNGKTITIGMLREAAALLLDMHGQHEHHSLLDSNKHLQLLDRFCQDELNEPKARLLEHIAEYRDLQQAINELEGVTDSNERLEFYQFQIKEIREAKLSAFEENELNQQKQILVNMDRISRYARGLIELNFAGILADGAAYAQNLAELDPSQAQNAEDLANLHAVAEDLALNFARYGENLDHDPAKLDEIEARLDILYRLKQKYKKNIPEILEYYEELQEKFVKIDNSRELLANLSNQKKNLEKEIGKTCLIMSKIRQDAAKTLAAQIEEILKDLGMKDAQFSIEIQRRKEFGKNGFDRANFLICANVGGELAPLSRIASGGEMSRVMLALKTALAAFDTIQTFVFDEIDAGISGRTAQQVAQKLAIIAKSHQILCITHLPQIAAMGDVNFLIEKSAQGENTLTHVHQLDENGVIAEIARLIGGAVITDTTRRAAKEMRKQANNLKNQ